MRNNRVAEMADHRRAVKRRFGQDTDFRQCSFQLQDANGCIDCDHVAMGRNGNIEFCHRQRPKKYQCFLNFAVRRAGRFCSDAPLGLDPAAIPSGPISSRPGLRARLFGRLALSP